MEVLQSSTTNSLFRNKRVVFRTSVESMRETKVTGGVKVDEKVRRLGLGPILGEGEWPWASNIFVLLCINLY